jgi:hypothetical protein
MISHKIDFDTIFIVCLIAGLVQTMACAFTGNMADLNVPISSFKDTIMIVQDLAFILDTHKCDAISKEGYMELNGAELELVPTAKGRACEI